MPLLTETPALEKSSSRQVLDTIRIWNRKGHYYIGLYLLFFLWLFTFTGLLLNHGWKFAEFWPTRKVTKFERDVRPLANGSDLEKARAVLEQLGIRGEIEWTATSTDAKHFDFRVNRPGHNFQISVVSDEGRATVEHTEINGWGVLRVLHTFTGARAGDSRNQRDWILTQVWAISMDAVAVGMIVLVLSGLYLWWGLPRKRAFGALALLAGTITCAFFVVGLRWMYS